MNHLRETILQVDQPIGSQRNKNIVAEQAKFFRKGIHRAIATPEEVMESLNSTNG